MPPGRADPPPRCTIDALRQYWSTVTARACNGGRPAAEVADATEHSVTVRHTPTAPPGVDDTSPLLDPVQPSVAVCYYLFYFIYTFIHLFIGAARYVMTSACEDCGVC